MNLNIIIGIVFVAVGMAGAGVFEFGKAPHHFYKLGYFLAGIGVVVLIWPTALQLLRSLS